MRIEFEKETHSYFVNGDMASISVTELLHKHGLSPSYKGVSKAVLRASATRGTEIHKDCEEVLNSAKYEPTTACGKEWQTWVENNLSCGVAEQMLAIEFDGVIIAGTADVMAFTKANERIIGDHKTTQKFNREYVSWQVSLLDYMARRIGKEKINGMPLNWVGATKFYCFWYNEDDKLEAIELEKIPDRDIEELLQAEHDNRIYKRKELVLNDDLKLAVESAENTLLAIEQEYKQAKARAEETRQMLANAMQEQGIMSWENEKFKVTYVPSTDRVSVDSVKLKRNFPVVYAECVKKSVVKPYVRVTAKAVDNEEEN